jgi:hypothetical protein
VRNDAGDAAGAGVLRAGRQGGERGVRAAQLDEALAEIRKPQDLGEAADRRTVEGRVGHAHHRKREIGGGDLPGLAAALAEREARVGVEQDLRAELEAIGLATLGQRLGRGHGFGQPRNQPVGPLQVVVLEQRVVDVAGDDVLFGTVGDRRVECLGRLGEGGVEHLLAPVGVRIGIVGAAGDGQAVGKRRKD